MISISDNFAYVFAFFKGLLCIIILSLQLGKENGNIPWNSGHSEFRKNDPGHPVATPEWLLSSFTDRDPASQGSRAHHTQETNRQTAGCMYT